jgi:hypothetical protein
MSIALIFVGIACLFVGGLIIYKLKPQEGQASSRWVESDARGTAVALGLLVLMLAGVSMVIKGFVW